MHEHYEQSAWSLYWSDDRLYSCVAQSSDADQKALNDMWRAFATTLDAGSSILDLATGNGAVANALLSAKSELKIDAVDKAAIDPAKFLRQENNLAAVSFHADTDILQLPFEARTFDAITSQFGIEYAGFKEATISVVKYLRPGGRMQFVVHHADSNIIRDSQSKVLELEQLTVSDGILDTLIKVLKGDCEFSKLEELGQAYINEAAVRTDTISGQVFTGIEQIARSVAERPKAALNLGVTLDLRVRAELVRMYQLIAAGQSEEEMQDWSHCILEETGLNAAYTPIILGSDGDDYLLGWLVKGHLKA